MYVPKHFAVSDRAELTRFIRAHPFGVLVSVDSAQPVATHVPFVVLNEGRETVLGLHVARANPHWQTLDGADVLAIFQGPHAFVSASWYEQPERSVPTWDYSAVHCRGRASLAAADATERILRALVAAHEGESGWSMEIAKPDYLEAMKRGIVAIQIAVSSMEGAFKLSQNRSEIERARVADELRTAAPDVAESILHGIKRSM